MNNFMHNLSFGLYVVDLHCQKQFQTFAQFPQMFRICLYELCVFLPLPLLQEQNGLNNLYLLNDLKHYKTSRGYYEYENTYAINKLTQSFNINYASFVRHLKIGFVRKKLCIFCFQWK